jgi:sensor histidine kinase YesM
MTLAAYLRKRITVLPWIIAGGIIQTYFTCRSCRTSFEYFLSISTLITSCWALAWFGNEYLHEVLDEKIDWTKYPVKRLMAGLVVMLLYTVVTISVVLKLSKTVFGLNVGDISESVYVSMGITLMISMVLTSRSFLFNWRQTAIDAEKFKRESTVAKFESLRNQVNPHFLFNSLNALTNLVYEDQDKAVKFIKQLSEVYRYLLETRDKEIVSLEEEKQFLQSYLFLQQIRFGQKLKLDISLEGKSSMVPPLVLQMLVENAIKHNVISEEHPLHIRIYINSDFIVVENNLQKKELLATDSQGIGLDNICKRYEFLTDKKVEVIVDKNFKVRLPMLYQA